jgi:hypothetical protein
METPPKTRVIAGALYVRSSEPYSFLHSVHNLGHGHLEALTMPQYAWREVDSLSPGALSDIQAGQGCIWVDGAWEPAPPPTAADLLEKAAHTLERSSRRAKTKVRRLCKAKGLTTMVTLTYRENQTDRARMARDFDVFVKRLRRVIPGFEYVCVFERQSRGAWHAHIAVARVLSHYLHCGILLRSYDLLRSMWRGVVGVDNGNIDVSRNKRMGRSAARLASYLSKYISKGFSLGQGLGDSYRASGRALPQPVRVVSFGSSLLDVLADLHALISVEAGSSKEFHSALLDCGGYFVTLSQ